MEIKGLAQNRASPFLVYTITIRLQIPVQHFADVWGLWLRLPTAHDFAYSNTFGIGQRVKVAAVVSVRHATCQEVVKIGLVQPVDGD